MTVQTKHWKQVGEHFEAIGTQLRRQIDEANVDAVADRDAFDEALHALLHAVEDSIDSAAKMVRNPALHKEFADLVDSVRDAVQATFEGARDQLSAATKGKHPMALKGSGPKNPANKPGADKPAARKTAPRGATSRTRAGNKPSAG